MYRWQLHAVKKATAAQNKWLWRPLRIGKLAKSATVSVGASASESRCAFFATGPVSVRAGNVIETHEHPGDFKEW